MTEPTVRPTSRVALALFAQPGDVVTWDEGRRWRWDGSQWQQLAPGDVCRNARDGSAMIWTGDHFEAPHVDNSQRDELAELLSTAANLTLVYARHVAEQLLRHGYTHTLNAPALQPITYTSHNLPPQPGDQITITWSNGAHITRTLTGYGEDTGHPIYGPPQP